MNFEPAPRLTALDVAEVLATVEPRIKRLLDRRGLGEGDDDGRASDAWAEDAPVLAGLAAASVQGTVALAPNRGARPRRLGDPPETCEAPALQGCHPRANGFDLHAGLMVRAVRRERLERVCRYTLRSPVSGDRLRVTGDGRVMLQLRHRWADGTTHLVFDPIEFLGRLAVLVPRPRINLLLYHGVLGPRATWRAEIVRRGTPAGDRETAVALATVAQAGEADTLHAARGQCWAVACERNRAGVTHEHVVVEQVRVPGQLESGEHRVAERERHHVALGRLETIDVAGEPDRPGRAVAVLVEKGAHELVAHRFAIGDAVSPGRWMERNHRARGHLTGRRNHLGGRRRDLRRRRHHTGQTEPQNDRSQLSWNH